MIAPMDTEPKAVRLVIQTDEDVRDALRLAAAKRRVDMSELGDSILREGLAEELKEVQSASPSERDGKSGRKK